MDKIVSRYRLKNSAFERPEENSQILPKRMVFLSVEGDQTERGYFQGLNQYLDATQVQIEILRHKRGDGYSDPQYVIELLQEYLAVRDGEIIPNDLNICLLERYSKDDMETYLNHPEDLNIQKRKEIESTLLNLGIDLNYRKYLSTYDREMDFFGVVLDRDSGSHSRELMEKCINYCSAHGFGCYISNPCFEFWLLLHLCDVVIEFNEDERNELVKNPKITNQHTKISKEISQRARHAKSISLQKFNEVYKENIGLAITRSKSFAVQYPELLDQLGTNIPDLFEVLKYPAADVL